MPNKSGPYSGDEKQFIADNAGQMSPKQIAEELRRNPDSVERYIKKNKIGQKFDLGGPPEDLSQGQVLKELKTIVSTQINTSEQ